DLRLRPDPGATNLAMSTSAALLYYESLGQNWERAAMIKARVIAGDVVAGEKFLAELVPFIWRKYLDFAAINDVHSIKRQINAYRGFTRGGIAGHNIKLGRGGIREIEFFVQTQQLIAGGRQKNLRDQRTLKALDALARHGWIDQAAASELGEAYRYLRRLENRLQMVADEQTQTLPTDRQALEQFAHFAGYSSITALDQELTGHLKIVERHYAALFEAAPELGGDQGRLVFTGGEDDPETLETLAAMGFDDARLVSEAVREWHYGRRAATRSPAARQSLTELMPALLGALAATQNPAQAFIAFDRFLARLPAGVQLFALLRANPNLLLLIADIMGTAPRLAHELSQRPRTLEAVLDPMFLAPLPSEADYRASAQAALGTPPSPEAMEDLLDRARAFGQEQFFRVGLRLLSASLSAEEAGAAYSGLAAGLTEALLLACERQLAAQVGKIAGSSVVVLAMGKFGGQEMAASSDLDLILIYDTDKGATETDGAKPISANQYFTRLTQRLVAALSVPTAEGRLYEVDMRLRPSGQKGPMATRLAAFRDYQNTSAQTWEKMALTRARVVAGSSTLAAQVEPVIRQVLCARRSASETARDVADMRNRIAEEKGTTDLWQLKQVRGGLVDIEFIVQFLQLVHASDHPQILSTNTGVALERLEKAGVISPGAAQDLRTALVLYQTLTQLLRLCLPPPCDPSEATIGLKRRLASAAGVPDFSVLEADLRATQAQVHQCFKQIIEGG
ncbi:MAG: bifunctional [glutamine synthetase] adenylyltransferase/[glutamine synthetase]-adenylyl-L-tyrosine phosphorylase, partial [Alphaproteobacteria bacterium]